MTTNSEKPSQEMQEILTNLTILLIRDAARICVVDDGSVEKDIDHVRLRARSEGISFFTKALPLYGTAMNRMLATGRLLDLVPPYANCKVTESGRIIPVFLSGFYEIVADALDVYEQEIGKLEIPTDIVIKHHAERVKNELGMKDDDTCPVEMLHTFATNVPKRFKRSLLEHCQSAAGVITGRAIAAIRAIRQITLFAYKLKVPLTRHDEEGALLLALKRDRELPMICRPLGERKLSRKTIETVRTARLILGCLLSDDPRVSSVLVPKHGPGALATRERSWEKWSFKRYYEALDECFPYSDYFYLNYDHLVESLDTLEALKPDTPVSMATCVPKDSRGPRVINMEPLELMFIQQALKGYLYDHIERNDLTRGYVNFTSQDVNRGVCLRSSYDLSHQTMDLKDASDRVSVQLIKELFPSHWIDMLLATRSVACNYGAKLGTWGLRKFAPMGSALCFPIESLVFWALSVSAIHGPVCHAGELRCLPEVYVFGDDIIVPTGSYETVESVFEELDLRVNKDKSCTSMFPFRESCGMDAINGVPIPVIRVKELWPDAYIERNKLKVSSPESCIAWCDYANAFKVAGYDLTNEYLFAKIRCSQWSALTHVTGDLRCMRPLGLYAANLDWCSLLASNARCRVRFNKSLQRQEIRVSKPLQVRKVVDREGWELLQAALTRHRRPVRGIWSAKDDPTTGALTLHLDSITPLNKRDKGNSRSVAVPNAIKFGYAWVPFEEFLNWPGVDNSTQMSGFWLRKELQF